VHRIAYSICGMSRIVRLSPLSLPSRRSDCTLDFYTSTIFDCGSNGFSTDLFHQASGLPPGIASQLSHSQSLQQAPFKAQPPKLRFVSSVEFRHSSGETSTTPLSPESPAEDSSGDHTRSRLQRSKAASRKTFRLKRSRLTPIETPSIVSN